MKHPTDEKLFAAVLVAAIAVSFVSTSNVQAQPTFPPTHYDANAVFVQADEQAVQPVGGPWYRPAKSTEIGIITDSFEPGFSGFAAASTDTGPWYRSTN